MSQGQRDLQRILEENRIEMMAMTDVNSEEIMQSKRLLFAENERVIKNNLSEVNVLF